MKKLCPWLFLPSEPLHFVMLIAWGLLLYCCPRSPYFVEGTISFVLWHILHDIRIVCFIYVYMRHIHAIIKALLWMLELVGNSKACQKCCWLSEIVNWYVLQKVCSSEHLNIDKLTFYELYCKTAVNFRSFHLSYFCIYFKSSLIKYFIYLWGEICSCLCYFFILLVSWQNHSISGNHTADIKIIYYGSVYWVSCDN